MKNGNEKMAHAMKRALMVRLGPLFAVPLLGTLGPSPVITDDPYLPSIGDAALGIITVIANLRGKMHVQSSRNRSTR